MIFVILGFLIGAVIGWKVGWKVNFTNDNDHGLAGVAAFACGLFFAICGFMVAVIMGIFFPSGNMFWVIK